MLRHLFSSLLVYVRGGGDLGSGVLYRLHRAGFPLVLGELPAPVFVRRAVCFGEAVYSGQTEIEGVPARLVTFDEIETVLAAGEIAVAVDPDGELLRTLRPAVVIDARMVKRNLGTRIDDAPLVIGLGPGFTAGKDCHAVIETNRGHDLGRVIWQGSAEPDTGEPGVMGGHTHSRVLRAPVDGHVSACAQIGDRLSAGQTIAEIDGRPVTAAFDGVLRGLIHEQVYARAGMKIGDLDPRGERRHCFTISDKSLAVGGGALEAILSAPQITALTASRSAG